MQPALLFFRFWFECLINMDPKSYWDVCPVGGGRLLPYMGYIGTFHCEGYGFQAVYSGIGYINQRV